jgi:hypothetical protein
MDLQTIGANFRGDDAGCTIRDTRANIIALRNASLLDIGCHYVITDHVQGQLVAGTEILLHADAVNEISENVMVNTPYDNDAWRGIYDIDRALVLELQDNRNNIARGINGTQVSQFDWGNTSYSNVVVDNATLTVDIGNATVKQNVTVTENALLNLTGFTGAINNVDVRKSAAFNLSGANGTWRLMRVWDGGSFNASNYTGGGDNYYNTVWGASTINFSATTQPIVFRQNEIQASVITNTGVTTAGATFTLTRSVMQSATITRPTTVNGALSVDTYQSQAGTTAHNTGTMTLASCLNLSSTIQQGTDAAAVMTLNQCIIEQASSVTNQAGTMAMTYTNVKVSTINNVAGSVGTTTVNYSSIFGSSNITRDATATTGLTVTYSEVENGSQIWQASGATMTVTRAIMLDNGNIQADASSGGTITITSVHVNGASAIRKFSTSTAGALTVNSGTRLDSSSIIYEQGTGDLTATQCSFFGASGIVRTAGDRGYSFVRSFMTGVARANLSGTGAGIVDLHNELELRYRGAYTNSATGASNLINYANVEGLTAAFNLTGTTGGSSFNRIKLFDGIITKNNNPNAGTYQLWSISNNSRVSLNNHANGDVINYLTMDTNSNFTINRTGAGNIQQVDIRNAGGFNALGDSTTISSLDIEMGNVTINSGSISNCSKKMSGTWTINAGAQNQSHAWTNAAVTSTVANTGRITCLGVASSVPIA